MASPRTNAVSRDNLDTIIEKIRSKSHGEVVAAFEARLDRITEAANKINNIIEYYRMFNDIEHTWLSTVGRPMPDFLGLVRVSTADIDLQVEILNDGLYRAGLEAEVGEARTAGEDDGHEEAEDTGPNQAERGTGDEGGTGAPPEADRTTARTTIPPLNPNMTGYHRTDAKLSKSVYKDKFLTTEEVTALAALLESINGQDGYDVETAASGALSKHEYLHIPSNMVDYFRSLNQNNIGLQCVHLTASDFIHIAALNATKLGSADVDLKVGFLRAHLCMLGYLNLDERDRPMHVKNVEVVFTDDTPSADMITKASEMFKNDKATIKKLHCLAQIAPVFMSEVFLRTGHHYIADPQAEWSNNYSKLFSASLMSSYFNLIPPNVLFHRALHWIGPYTCRLAWTNLEKTSALPMAMKLRYKVAPAGSALITTTAAIISNLSRFSFFEDIKIAYGEEVGDIVEYAAYIREHSTSYFALPELFGLAPLSESDRETFLAFRELATKLCVVCQAYIEAIARNTAIGKAKALKKVADEQPMQKKALVGWFKNFASELANTNKLINLLKMTTD